MEVCQKYYKIDLDFLDFQIIIIYLNKMIYIFPLSNKNTFSLRKGDTIFRQIRPQKEGESFFINANKLYE